jgi:AraC-like DNA-binding protein
MALRKTEREHAWRWRDDALGDVEFVDAHYRTHRFAPHSHESYGFGVIEAGAEDLWYRGANRIALPGRVVALDPGEVHTGGVARGATELVTRRVYPSIDMVQRAAEAAGCRSSLPSFRECIIVDDEAAALLSRFHFSVMQREGALHEAGALVEALTLLVCRHASTRAINVLGPAPRSAVLAREYLEANFRRNVSLAELSAVAEASSFHLARQFRAAFGMPPHRYLDQQRVREAQRLIRCGQPLSFVAASAGFADQSQLTRHFKRHFGVTPGVYQQCIRVRSARAIDSRR